MVVGVEHNMGIEELALWQLERKQPTYIQALPRRGCVKDEDRWSAMRISRILSEYLIVEYYQRRHPS